MTPENTMLLTTPTEYSIVAAMPRKKTVNIPKALRGFQQKRADETGKPFTQEMMAEELGVPVGTLYHWMQTPGTVGARSPRGLSRELLLMKLGENGETAKA